MRLQSIKNEEKLINNILFFYILAVAVSGWAFVMIFLNGGVRRMYFSVVRLMRNHNQTVRKKSRE